MPAFILVSHRQEAQLIRSVYFMDYEGDPVNLTTYKLKTRELFAVYSCWLTAACMIVNTCSTGSTLVPIQLA